MPIIIVWQRRVMEKKKYYNVVKPSLSIINECLITILILERHIPQKRIFIYIYPNFKILIYENKGKVTQILMTSKL